LLEGNHEKWLRYYAFEDTNKILSKEFINQTHKQIKSLDKKQLRAFVRKLDLCLYFTFGDNKKQYFINHSGYPRLFNGLTLGSDLTDGVGGYGDIEQVQKTFNDQENSFSNHLVQIHAHRNPTMELADAVNNCYNLCDSIEFGGNLRVLTINKDNKVGVQYIKNDTFKSKGNTDFKTEKQIAEIQNLEADEHITLINKLNKSKDINKKLLDDNIVSYSFSRDIFSKGWWNDITVKARGLFINQKTTNVVARSYDKFWEL
jgi:hypothetical protein